MEAPLSRIGVIFTSSNFLRSNVVIFINAIGWRTNCVPGALFHRNSSSMDNRSKRNTIVGYGIATKILYAKTAQLSCNVHFFERSLHYDLDEGSATFPSNLNNSKIAFVKWVPLFVLLTRVVQSQYTYVWCNIRMQDYPWSSAFHYRDVALSSYRVNSQTLRLFFHQFSLRIGRDKLTKLIFFSSGVVSLR